MFDEIGIEKKGIEVDKVEIKDLKVTEDGLEAKVVVEGKDVTEGGEKIVEIDADVKVTENLSDEEKAALEKTDESKAAESLAENALSEENALNQGIGATEEGYYTPGQCARISSGTQKYCPFAGSGR